MWSPHLYKSRGLKKGYSEPLLEAAIEQSDRVINSPFSLPSILSLKHLSKRTGIGYLRLRSFINRSNTDAYQKFSIRKRSGGRRFIHIPTSDLMFVQRWINQYILKKIPPHQSSYAFNAGSSIKKCAAKHCGARWLIKLDIMDFFASVSEIQVYRLFNEIGYQPLVAFELGRLCTVPTSSFSSRKQYRHWHSNKVNEAIPEYSQSLLGYLPQGAATSPLISNLVMRRSDEKLSMIANKYGMTYTRYSDDLSFSTRSRNFTREKARNVIYDVYMILAECGYKPQYRKTKIIPPGSKKIILGLNVDGAFPALQKEFKDRIRQHFHYLEKFGIDEHVVKRGFDSIWGFKSHLKGLIDFAKMIEPEYAKIQLQRFERIVWPV